jgi:hypothetical protein
VELTDVDGLEVWKTLEALTYVVVIESLTLLEVWFFIRKFEIQDIFLFYLKFPKEFRSFEE